MVAVCSRLKTRPTTPQAGKARSGAIRATVFLRIRTSRQPAPKWLESRSGFRWLAHICARLL